ncbi:MAG: SDR family NAD(P)-dependent oxidoreductase [Chloroflexota bacterium]
MGPAPVSQVSGPANLRGQVALVTGAARGIGRAICCALAREGARVVACDLLDCAQTVNQIHEAGGAAEAACLDVTDRSRVTALVADVAARYGTVHILVNNAGTCHRVSLQNTTDEAWDVDVNSIMRGTYLLTQAVYPLMVAQRYGKIVNVSSVSGKIGGAVSRADRALDEGSGRSGPAYAAAKGGVLAFTRWVAKDAGRHNIFVNAVCPGPVESEMTRGFAYDVASQPIARMGQPEDVAEAVLFLASQAANFITGQALNVDGGLVMD